MKKAKKDPQDKPKRNPYLDVQIMNEIMETENFVKLCNAAAKKDDGAIDVNEAKMLKAIKKRSQSYIKALRKLIP